MRGEPEPDRLAVWRVHNGCDAVQLRIDLDHDQAVTLTIGEDGRTTAMLSDRVAKWLMKEIAGR